MAFLRRNKYSTQIREIAMTDTSSREWKAYQLQQDWATNPRWSGVRRGYTAEEVVNLQGSDPVEHSRHDVVPTNCGSIYTQSPMWPPWVR